MFCNDEVYPDEGALLNNVNIAETFLVTSCGYFALSLINSKTLFS